MKSRWGCYIVIFKNGYSSAYGRSYDSIQELKEEIWESFEEQTNDIHKIVFTFGIQHWLVEGNDQVEHFMENRWESEV